MIRPQLFRAKLADKLILNQKFVQYFFELVEPNQMAFDAGQYASISIPGTDGLRRSYSICSSPVKDHGFELMVDLTPNGVGVQYLNKLQFGDEIQMLSPLGMFTIAPDVVNRNPIVCVATGSGITPFRSMLAHQLVQLHNTQPITVYWGMRYVEELFWQDEFQDLMTQFPNFHFHPVISRASQEWPLCRGHVTDCLSIHALPENADYYLCGNDKMIADVMQVLQTKGVEKTRLHHEKFY